MTESLPYLLTKNTEKTEELKKEIQLKYPVPLWQKELQVQVDQGAALGMQEQRFLQNRMLYVQKVLQQEFGIKKPLRLAFCCSGGGNRAMIGSLGLFTAAARYNFLQAAVYCVGLSGSTWLIAPWSYMYLKSLLSPSFETSLGEFKSMLVDVLDYPCQTLTKAMCTPPKLDTKMKQEFSENLSKRFGYNKVITAVDIYGALIGNFALQDVGPTRLDTVWSSITYKVQQGQIPLPLCAACLDAGEQRYEFFETSPFQAGSNVLGYIPMWSLGSQFDNGKMIEPALEYPLSFYLGLYGSAFSITMEDVIKRIPVPTFKVFGQNIILPVNTWMRDIVDFTNKSIREQRLYKAYAQFFNYSKGLQNSPLKEKDRISLFDAGIYINLPLPLLTERPERQVDLVIMYDSGSKSLNELHKLSRYFLRQGVKMPDFSQVEQLEYVSKPMLVFNDPRKDDYDKNMLTIVYFRTPNKDISKFPYNIDTSKYPDIVQPIDNSKIPYITPNFKYSKAEINNLAQTMEAIFESQVSEIKKIMKLVAQKRK